MFVDGDGVTGSRRAAGEYTHRVVDGFAAARASVAVAADATIERADLPLATLTQTVEVTAPARHRPPTRSARRRRSTAARRTSTRTGAGWAALRLLASVIEVPGGVSIKGGRPTQAGVQIGASTLTDPVLARPLHAADDAIDSVAVMPNPCCRYGRFSSGLVLIQTRCAARRLRPAQQPQPDVPQQATRIYNVRHRRLRPQLRAGRMIVKDRVFLSRRRSIATAATTCPAGRKTSAASRTGSAPSRASMPT